MPILTRKIKATYIGPDHPHYKKDEEITIKTFTQSEKPEMEILTHDDKTSIRYPSKKKFLEHWKPEDRWERSETIYRSLSAIRGKVKKQAPDINIADAGAVIYTELMAAVNRFNAKSTLTYKENPEELSMFTIRLEKQIYDAKTQKKSGLYGAGVLIVEVEKQGVKHFVYQDGVSFNTERDMDNINGYAPKLYINLLNSFVESALLYIIALAPDGKKESAGSNPGE